MYFWVRVFSPFLSCVFILAKWKAQLDIFYVFKKNEWLKETQKVCGLSCIEEWAGSKIGDNIKLRKGLRWSAQLNNLFKKKTDVYSEEKINLGLVPLFGLGCVPGILRMWAFPRVVCIRLLFYLNKIYAWIYQAMQYVFRSFFSSLNTRNRKKPRLHFLCIHSFTQVIWEHNLEKSNKSIKANKKKL